MSRRERLERRLERREQWARARGTQAERGFAHARALVENIPPGQPILVGHHSEGRHRRVLERHDNAMRRACESADMAGHHASKAMGLEHQLERSIFSDDADARERIAEKIATVEAERARMREANAAIRKHKKAGAAAQVTALGMLGYSESIARKMLEPDFCGRIGFPDYAFSNRAGEIKRLKDRLADLDRRAERDKAVEAAGGVLIVGDSFVNVTFAEKPDRAILEALRAAGFAWGGGCWGGYRERLPESVLALAEAARG